jgi:hypothetical protein
VRRDDDVHVEARQEIEKVLDLAIGRTFVTRERRTGRIVRRRERRRPLVEQIVVDRRERIDDERLVLMALGEQRPDFVDQRRRDRS